MILFFASCDEHFEADDLYGYYAPALYKNTFDTIQLKPDSIYHRKVYDKNNKLVLEMNGNWQLERNNIIHFTPFYLNLDVDLSKFPQSVNDTSGGWQGRLETRNGVIGFCVGYFAKIDTNCYRKVK